MSFSRKKRWNFSDAHEPALQASEVKCFILEIFDTKFKKLDGNIYLITVSQIEIHPLIT